MSKKEVMNLELSERPMLDVSVAAERITVLPVEPGGVTRVELEARRHSDGPLLKLERQGDVLLVQWLGELAYWAERDGFVAPQVEWEAFLPTSLAATVRGGRLAELQKHIKAVTYHDLAIRPIGDGLEATIVFDV